MVVALILVASAVAIASFTVKPSKARAFDLFYGSLFIDDDTAPVSIDLASGKPTVRLPDAYQQVNAKQPGDVTVVPLAGGTLLLDTLTGEFNMVDGTGIVAKSGGGVSVGTSSVATTSLGLASGSSAYIVRTGASGTSVFLVSLSTVTSAIGGGPVRPRASIGMTEPLTDPPKSTVTANADLWLLAGSGATRKIRQLSVPHGSNPGVSLTETDHGSVSGTSAIGVSTAKADGSGGDAVAVASPKSIQVFDPAGGSHSVGVSGQSNVESILPVTNQQGAFAFLYLSPNGWSLVRTPVDGAGTAGVQPLDGIDGAARLAQPAQSDGSLYTADTTTGALWRINGAGAASPVPDVSKYPIISGETTDFSQIQVLARGARVIFNSRSKIQEVTVFADGSHQPVINRKSSAVDATANGAAAALSDLQHNTNPSKAPQKTRVDPAQQVTDKINCQTVKQIPHVPSVDLVDRGSRSVQLQWTYPLLDRQDCAPSTYTVTVGLLGGNAPAAPHLPPIQGSTGVNVTGLFPDTQYKFTVTAYINGKGTPSAPLDVRTSVEGPAAPTNVQATADDQGNWNVTWNSCGGVQNNCVPAGNWTIIPQLCDGAGGLVNAPSNGHVVGDPTSHTFSYTYKGNGSLLGRGMNFQVAGIGLKGTTGTTSKASSCAYSWAHPVPGDIHVAASTPPAVSGQSTSRTTVTVSFTGDKNVALGGAGGQLTYQLLSAGSTVTTSGPTSDTSVSLAGIRPGQSYSVRVTVSPPRHPTSSVSLPPASVEAAVANWPTLTTTASFGKDNYYLGTLTLAIGGLTSAQARGETFDLTNSSQLVCGNTVMPLNANNFDPAKPLRFGNIDRTDFNGGCRASIQLTENSSTKRNPAYFGGNPSHAAAADVTLPVPDSVATADQFTAGFESGSGYGHLLLAVSYQSGSDKLNSLMQSHTDHWSIQVSNDNGATFACGSSSDNPSGSPAEINVPTSCAKGGAVWKVQVSFAFFGTTPSGLPFGIPISSSSVPKPVDPTQISFDASRPYGGGYVHVDYNGPYDQGTLDALQWTETITSDQSPGVCNVGGSPNHDVPSVFATGFNIDLTACPEQVDGGASGSGPVTANYTIEIQFTDPYYGTTGDYKVPIN
jgi:hypothetical protein